MDNLNETMTFIQSTHAVRQGVACCSCNQVSLLAFVLFTILHALITLGFYFMGFFFSLGFGVATLAP